MKLYQGAKWFVYQLCTVKTPALRYGLLECTDVQILEQFSSLLKNCVSLLVPVETALPLLSSAAETEVSRALTPAELGNVMVHDVMTHYLIDIVRCT